MKAPRRRPLQARVSVPALFSRSRLVGSFRSARKHSAHKDAQAAACGRVRTPHSRSSQIRAIAVSLRCVRRLEHIHMCTRGDVNELQTWSETDRGPRTVVPLLTHNAARENFDLSDLHLLHLKNRDIVKIGKNIE